MTEGAAGAWVSRPGRDSGSSARSPGGSERVRDSAGDAHSGSPESAGSGLGCGVGSGSGPLAATYEDALGAKKSTAKPK